MQSSTYDVIVIGLGSMGLSTVHYLSRAGFNVLGLEQFSIYNDKASHSGDTRLIRKSYFEHSDYVPMLSLAYNNWYELERLTSKKLFYKTGISYMGDANGPILSGVQRSAAQYDITIDERWTPIFNKAVAKDALFEPEAGYLDVYQTFEVLKGLCEKQGAILKEYQKVTQWKREGDLIAVSVGEEVYKSKQLVITAGSWMQKLVPMKLSLKVSRQVVAWFETSDRTLDIPCWSLDHPEGKGIYYGFSRTERGFKIGHHFQGEVTDPDYVNRKVEEEETQELKEVLEKMLPGNSFQLMNTATCLYTNSSDEHFIIDYLPDSDHSVVLAGGFSGHGYKFVTAVGSLVTDLVKKQDTSVSIDFLSLKRFQ